MVVKILKDAKNNKGIEKALALVREISLFFN